MTKTFIFWRSSVTLLPRLLTLPFTLMCSNKYFSCRKFNIKQNALASVISDILKIHTDVKNTYKISDIHNAIFSDVCTIDGKTKLNLLLFSLAAKSGFLAYFTSSGCCFSSNTTFLLSWFSSDSFNCFWIFFSFSWFSGWCWFSSGFWCCGCFFWFFFFSSWSLFRLFLGGWSFLWLLFLGWCIFATTIEKNK